MKDEENFKFYIRLCLFLYSVTLVFVLMLSFKALELESRIEKLERINSK